MSNNPIYNKPIPNKKYDIHERIFTFIIRVVNLSKSLSKTQQNLIIINQIMRSVTSIGANDQEADGSTSRKDFIHCYTLVRKEAKETYFWLRLISEINPQLKKRMEGLLQENNEIIAIVSSIIGKTKNH